MLNPRSGTLASTGIDRGRERIAAACKACGIAATIEVVPGSGISDRVRDEVALRRGSAPRFDVVVIGGGDGSIGAAALALAGSDVPLGVLPLGTFNHLRGI